MTATEESFEGGVKTYHSEEDENHSHTEGETGDNGNDPVDGRLSSPGEPEETDGKHNSGNATKRETSFRGQSSTSLDEVPDVSLVLEDVGNDGAEHTETDSDEGERGDSRGPSSVLVEDDGNGSEEQVEYTAEKERRQERAPSVSSKETRHEKRTGSLDEGGVERHEENDHFLEEEDERTSNRSLHLLSKRSGEHGVKVELRTEDFASFLLKLGGLATEEDGSVSLGVEETEDKHDEGEDDQDVEDPPPRGRNSDETTDDGS